MFNKQEYDKEFIESTKDILSVFGLVYLGTTIFMGFICTLECVNLTSKAELFEIMFFSMLAGYGILSFMFVYCLLGNLYDFKKKSKAKEREEIKRILAYIEKGEK